MATVCVLKMSELLDLVNGLRSTVNEYVMVY